MPQFRYQAVNADNQLVAGEVVAETVGDAISQLEVAGLTVHSIGYADLSRIASPGRPATSGLATLAASEHAALITHLQEIVNRSRVLVPALSAYATELPPSRARHRLNAFLRLLQADDASESVNALARQPAHWIPLVNSVTTEGDHGQLLKALLREYDPSQEASPRGSGWLVYPVVVSCVAMAVLFLIGNLVVPVFRDLFSSFGLRLPGLTQLVLAFYAAITSKTFVIIAALIASGFVFANRVAAAAARISYIDGANAPLSRPLALAQFSRHLAELLDAGLSPSAALRLTSSAIARPRLKKAALKLGAALAASDEPPNPVDRSVLTSTLVYAIEADISGPPRSAILRELSRCYEDRAYGAFSWTSSGFEPAAIIVIGILIGLTVLALYLPMFSLLQALT